MLCLSWDTVHPGKPRVRRNEASSPTLTISGHARLPLSYKLGGLFCAATAAASVLASNVNLGRVRNVGGKIIAAKFTPDTGMGTATLLSSAEKCKLGNL